MTTLRWLAGALVIHAALSAAFVATVCEDHDARRMDARWLHGPVDAELMVAGDSHARFSVEAVQLGRAMNVAVPGEHYLKSMYRVPWLLDHGTRGCGAVVLPYDAASFSSFKTDAWGPEAVWGRYADFLELAHLRGDPLRYGGRWAKAVAAPYVGELDVTLQWLAGSRHFRDPTDPQAGWTVPDLESGAEAARRHFEGADPWDPAMVEALRRLVIELRSRSIRVVLVRFPVTAAYAKESRRLGSDPALRDALLEELTAGGGVDHLDHEGLFFRQPELFVDGDHLSARGKHVYTKVLGPELAALGLLQGAP